MSTAGRPRLAVYWTSGCGGCEAAFLDLGDRLLALERDFELVFFPLLIDRKMEDLDRCGAGSIDLALVTGAIRTNDDLRMAQKLRRAARTLGALGACAQLGSVLALANLVDVETLLRRVYGEAFASGDLASCVEINDAATMSELPRLVASLQTLGDSVPVDFAVPGCPPEVDQLWQAIQTAAGTLCRGQELPESGSVLGGSDATVCEDCVRQRPEGKVARFRRIHEVDADASRCLLDEGIVCSGPATRGGCGAPCTLAGAPCRGCYGHSSGIEDQGARLLGALAVMMEVGDLATEPGHLRQQTEMALDSLVDPVGTLYRYCFAHSLLSLLEEPTRAES